jgi:prepilin-type N-terminal cleavage/methylation domain-containing protein
MNERMEAVAGRSRGFTLIELVVVVGIVAIIAAIALPFLSANKDRAVWAQAKANLDAVRSALAVYNANTSNDSFPGPSTGDYQQIRALLSDANLPPRAREAGWDPSYLQYSVSGSARWYTLEVKTGNRYGDILTATPSGVTPVSFSH